jgi:hypothetical protein
MRAQMLKLKVKTTEGFLPLKYGKLTAIHNGNMKSDNGY